MSETELYEVNGFYVQYAPELLDYDGCYVKNDSLVCDRNSRKWHVSYYYKNKTLHIILDNEKGDCQVVKNFSGFSVNLRMGYYIPSFESEEKITEKTSGGEREKFHILPVLAAVGIGLAFILLIVLLAVDFENFAVCFSTVFSGVLNAFATDLLRE